MAEAAAALGVDPKDLVLETESRDTEEEASLIQKMVKKDAFILVTSAAHMPRSMTHFRSLALNRYPPRRTSRPRGIRFGVRGRFFLRPKPFQKPRPPFMNTWAWLGG